MERRRISGSVRESGGWRRCTVFCESFALSFIAFANPSASLSRPTHLSFAARSASAKEDRSLLRTTLALYSQRSTPPIKHTQ